MMTQTEVVFQILSYVQAQTQHLYHEHITLSLRLFLQKMFSRKLVFYFLVLDPVYP